MTPVLAHIGHWYAEILYVAPVILMGGWLAFTSRREKRRDARSQGQPAPQDRLG